MIERPGSGIAAPHPYHTFSGFAADMAHVADALGAERLGVVGLSGGGPYALSCAGTAALADRVVAVAVLGGVTASVGPDATASGPIKLARQLAPVSSGLREPFAWITAGLLFPIIPLAHYVYQGLTRVMPEGDQRVFADPEIEAMFVDDVVCARSEER